MKKMKKVLAMVLSLAMVFAMSLTAFAETKTEGVTGSKTDKVKVEVSGLSGGETVTLYQIAAGDYQGDGERAFKGYTWATGISEELQKKAETATASTNLSSQDITDIVNGIKNGTITAINTTTETAAGAKYEKEVAVGAYIAVITGATDNSVYNPIYLTATYNEAGALVGGEINASTAMYGSEAVAKKTSPDIKKEIVEGTTPDKDENDKDIHTGSVGDVITYKITPTVPSYPKTAKNKTLFVTDKMSSGLTYDPSSLTIKIGTGENKTDVKAVNGTFTYNEKAIATVTENENGFNINFNYENILVNADTDRTAYDLEVVYSARLNEEAVVGKPGNPNDAKMYYANDPTTGSTFEPGEDHPTPEEAEGVTKKEDSETVFTYKIAFKKVDSGDKSEALEGAVFGIYKDQTCRELVDVVTTNSNGYAVSTRVAAGTYYVKEIAAPAGYSLSETVHTVQAVWTSMTTTSKTETSNTVYTTEVSEAVEPKTQVGWIKDSKFYAMDVFDGTEEGVAKAYVKETSTTTSAEIDFKKNEDAGAGTNLFDEAVPNTKMSALPSTGGIGTTIFTIGGCIIMIIAAGLFFASRRKKAEN